MVVHYKTLQKMLSSTSSATTSLTGAKDSKVKKYRFDLQKAINITINSISANSGEGLTEKITHLRALMEGRQVSVMGKQVDIGQHPEARLYCCNLLALKLVVRYDVCTSVCLCVACCMCVLPCLVPPPVCGGTTHRRRYPAS